MSDDFDDDGDEEVTGITVIIDYVQHVSVVRFLGGKMVPSRLAIKTEVLPAEKVEDLEFDLAFAKIKFWFETIVAHSIVFCKDNELAHGMLIDAETGLPRMTNQIMMTPFEPTDEHLAVLFQSKLSALSGGKVEFGHIEVKADTSSGLVFTYVGDWVNDLPEMKDWFDKTPYWFELPWWARNDSSMVDLVAGEVDLEKPPAWAVKLDFIENAMRPKKAAPETPEEVVIKFKPKIIDGGKDNNPSPE